VLLLARVTTIPPEGAKPFSVTVQASVPAPVIEALPQESDFKLASPVPLRVTVVEAPVEELLAIAIWPVAVPEVVGSNWMLSVAVWPGLRVSGNVIPDEVKPAPEIAAEVTLTGPVPVDVNVSDCETVVFRATLPKFALEELIPRIDVPGFSWIAKPCVAVPELAVRVTDSGEVTDETVAEKPALVAPLGTVTVAGSVTAALLLDKLTVRPLLGAEPDKVTVQESVPAPVKEAVLQERAFNVDVETPAPVMLITTLPWDELLATVTTPVELPTWDE
jgi:hypothetical protein